MVLGNFETYQAASVSLVPLRVLGQSLACEHRGEGKGKRESVGMTKDFGFQTQVIYVMLQINYLRSEHRVILASEP